MLRLIKTTFVLLILFAQSAFVGDVCAQDLTNLGGDLTTTLVGPNAIQVAAPNVSTDELKQIQLSGFDPFHTINSKKTGLGPRFVHRSCGGCHVQNGKGRTRIARKKPANLSMVIKISLPGLQENNAPQDVPGIGEQLQPRTLRGRSLYRLRLRWRRVRGEYPDGTKYKLRKPRLRYRIRGYGRSETVSSLRMTPALIGLGLLEAIPEATILGMSDPEDSNEDGISGRPSYVPNKKTNETVLGRFGFRATNPTVEQQTAAAAFFDMGVSTTLFPSIFGGDPELSDDLLFRLTVYQQLAGVPIARDQEQASVLRGKDLFQITGCDDCHTMTLTTESDEYPELDGQEIHPFTDMLLHDMGPDLADERPEFSASGSEWRTTPLWGLGFASTLSKVRLRYLHDGRARSIEEAILWHGGEALAAREKFKLLHKDDRAALIAFLESL